MNWFIIIFVIIAIALYLITKYYVLKKQSVKEKIENFQNEQKLSPTEKLSKYHNVKLEFLSPSEARGLVERGGKYFAGMNKPNLAARGCNSIDELYDKYLDAFDTITDDEQNKVTLFMNELLDDIKHRNESLYRYISRWLNSSSLAKAKPWLEGGMPHTLKQTLVMDAAWYQQPRRGTFIHELAHVHQRSHPFEYEDLYDALGYVYYPEPIKGLEFVYELNRNNPDGLAKEWVWHNRVNDTYWWIGAIFKGIEPASLGDVNYVALKLERSADSKFYYLKQTPTPLSKLEGFDKYFGNNPNNYHPNEMGAKFAEWFLEDVLGSENRKQYYSYPGYLVYKKYFQNVLDKYY